MIANVKYELVHNVFNFIISQKISKLQQITFILVKLIKNELSTQSIKNEIF